jgi:two-component system phosphate regulon response regulator PhoB
MERLIHIVEDDEDIRYILEYVLCEAGYSLQLFDSINDFKKRDKTQQPDLFLLDVRLPDGSGLDLCREIKSSPLTSDIPVVIMSAHANGEFAISDGKADHFLAKPFDLDRFVMKIKMVLDAKSNAS